MKSCDMCDGTWSLACHVDRLPCGCLVCERMTCRTLHRISGDCLEEKGEVHGVRETEMRLRKAS